MNYKIIIINLMLIPHFTFSFNDYYWRDYTGQIPSDAFSAGEDINGDKIYIGQAYVGLKESSGIFVSTIYPGKEVRAPILGARKPNNFIQILCSQRQEYFQWVAANATHLHLFPHTTNFVRGGVENNLWLNIGRVWYQGDTVLGKVLAGNIGNAEMWFVYGDKENEHMVNSYEVLTYNGHGVDNIDLRSSLT